MSKLIATLLLVAAAQVAPAPPPVTRRDAPPPRTGTAVIRGRITERDTNVPVVRIPIKLFRIGWTRPYETRADDEGRFEFTRLAAGQRLCGTATQPCDAFQLVHTVAPRPLRRVQIRVMAAELSEARTRSATFQVGDTPFA